ncbi:hypothetical protein ACFY0R_37875 [Streptomyces sp. NPDC001633]|uniref:hypothetical protein n=1 Tax=Streptomyces sp. NPDC001633 TaxID=3364595 RepID=UPI00367F4378
MSEISVSDPYAYRYVVEGPQRARAYSGPLAWTEGRMVVGYSAELTVRVHDAGQLGNLRREVAERLAWNYGVRGRRFEEAIFFSRQGGRFTGEEVRVARHALRIEGDPLKVARFCADLPGLLAAIEQAATAMMRRLSRWVRDSAHGQRWTDWYDANYRRTERRYWRRAYILHLADRIGPEAPAVGEVDMPDWSENWLQLQARIAQATADQVDIEAVRDHMTEALLFARAAHVERLPVEEPLPQRTTRYATTYEALEAPEEWNDEIGDVEFCYGDPAELARIAERHAMAAATTVEETTADEVAPATPTAPGPHVLLGRAASGQRRVARHLPRPHTECAHQRRPRTSAPPSARHHPTGGGHCDRRRARRRGHPWPLAAEPPHPSRPGMRRRALHRQPAGLAVRPQPRNQHGMMTTPDTTRKRPRDRAAHRHPTAHHLRPRQHHRSPHR